MKKKVFKVGKARAIEIAMNHNCISKEMAEQYTNSELKEILLHLNRTSKTIKLQADF